MEYLFTGRVSTRSHWYPILSMGGGEDYEWCSLSKLVEDTFVSNGANGQLFTGIPAKHLKKLSKTNKNWRGSFTQCLLCSTSGCPRLFLCIKQSVYTCNTCTISLYYYCIRVVLLIGGRGFGEYAYLIGRISKCLEAGSRGKVVVGGDLIGRWIWRESVSSCWLDNLFFNILLLIKMDDPVKTQLHSKLNDFSSLTRYYFNNTVFLYNSVFRPRVTVISVIIIIHCRVVTCVIILIGIC